MSEWKYVLPTALRGQLVESIHEPNYSEILNMLHKCYDWILANVDEYDEIDYDRDIDDIEFWQDGTVTEDDADEIDYLLSNFYDVCDAYHIWASAI